MPATTPAHVVGCVGVVGAVDVGVAARLFVGTATDFCTVVVGAVAR